jgi:hypothetical protein
LESVLFETVCLFFSQQGGGTELPLPVASQTFASEPILATRAETRKVFAATLQRTIPKLILTLILFLAFPGSGDAYSVLSHEAIVDAAWSNAHRAAA